MIGRVVTLFALFSSSCASAPAAAPAPEPAALEFFTYRTTVASVSAGASNLTVSVRLPEEWPAGVMRPLQAYGLVGNAPFEFPFVEGPTLPGTSAGSSSRTLTDGTTKLSVHTAEEGGIRYREFVVETNGKPLELSLRLAQMAGAPIEASALEQELVRGTTATADGKPVEALATRLERVK
jgi:hypothetical protein